MLRNRMKQAIALLLALVLIASGMVIAPTQAEAANPVTYLHSVYIILPDGTAEYVKPETKNCTSIHIPAAIKVNGKDYKVVSIRANACKNCKDLIRATIGANVKKIGKKAFYGCERLIELSIYSTKLTTKTVAKDAFKGTGKITRIWTTGPLPKGKKAYAVVPEKKVNQYEKVLKAAGANVKKWEFKYVDKSMQDKTTWDNYDPSQPIPEPEYSEYCFYNVYNRGKTESNSSDKGSTSIFIRTRPNPRLFGDWVKEASFGCVDHCNICGRNFESTAMDCAHYGLMTCSYWHTLGTNIAFNGWVFYPDDTPLKVAYELTLPDGVYCDKDSVAVWEAQLSKVRTEYCDIQIFGNKVIVTINNAKAEPFYYQFNKTGYDKDPYGYIKNYDDPLRKKTGEITGNPPMLGLILNVKFNGNQQTDNPIHVAVRYEYKGTSTTFDLGTLMLHYKIYQY